MASVPSRPTSHLAVWDCAHGIAGEHVATPISPSTEGLDEEGGEVKAMGLGPGQAGFAIEDLVALEETSSASPALASWQGRLYLAWTGNDLRLNTISTPDGRRFSDKRTLDHKSYKTVSKTSSSSSGFTETRTVALGPSLAGSQSGLQLAWTGSDRHLNLVEVGPSGRPSHIRLREKSQQPPSVAEVAGGVALAWTGTDRRLNLIVSQGHPLGEPIHMAQTSSEAPAVCAIEDELALAWTGTDRRLNLIVSQGHSLGEPIHVAETSSEAPAVCAIDDELALAWTGTDRRLNVIVSQGRSLGQPVHVAQTSPHAPAVSYHFGELVLAWTGRDRRLNLGRMRRVS